MGVLCAPWVGVPTRGMGSLSLVAQHVSRQLADEWDLTLVAGTRERDPSQQVHGVAYHAVSDLPDRLWLRSGSHVRARIRGDHRHLFHRDSFYPFYARQAAKVFRRAGCEVVLVSQFPQWLGVLRKCLPEARLVLWAHAATMAEQPGSSRQLMAEADGVVACSSYVARRIEACVPSLQGRTDVVYNGFDPSLFFPRLQPPRGVATVLYVGRITPEKGVHVLVEAFRRLASQRGNVQLVLCGPVSGADSSAVPGTDPRHLQEIAGLSGDYRSLLLERAGEYREHIHFTGTLPQRDLGVLYRTADVLVFPALWEEPFGMPVVEAAACGTPVVATRRGGIPELINEGHSGLLVPSGDSRRLAEAIDQVLDDPYWRDSHRIATSASPRFQWSSSAESLRHVLRSNYLRVSR